MPQLTILVQPLLATFAFAFTLPSQAPAPAAPTPAPAAKSTAPLDVPKAEADLDRAASGALLAFARAAETNKLPSRSKPIYEQILDWYDTDNAAARQALGFRKDKGAWQPAPAGKEPKWIDAATPQLKQRTDEAWAATRKKLAALHRTLGLQLLAIDNLVRGRFHLERALHFDPTDVEAHKGLGHTERNGFYGSDEQLAFVDRMTAIQTKVRELRAQGFAPQPLDAAAMPIELQRTGLALTGARTEHFTLWTRGDQAHSAACAEWAERDLALLGWLVGDTRAAMVIGRASQFHWIAMLRDHAERDLFFQMSPAMLGKLPLAMVQTFGGYTVESATGSAAVAWHRAELDFDYAIGHTTEHVLSAWGNAGLGEGLLHASTWLLVGTTWTTYGWLPSTDAGSFRLREGHPDSWLARLRGQIEKGEDWPLIQVPREQLSNFRPDVRTKSWWFMVWLLARYPDQWYDLLQELRGKDQQVLLPDQIAARIQKVLGADAVDIEAEWRDWALGKSPLAKATGFGAGAAK